MTAPAVATPTPVTGVGRRQRTRRGAELMLLVFAMLVVLVYSAAVETGLLQSVTPDFWVPVGILFVVFLGVHIAIRFLAPYADPILLPTVALINGWVPGIADDYPILTYGSRSGDFATKSGLVQGDVHLAPGARPAIETVGGMSLYLVGASVLSPWVPYPWLVTAALGASFSVYAAGVALEADVVVPDPSVVVPSSAPSRRSFFNCMATVFDAVTRDFLQATTGVAPWPP